MLLAIAAFGAVLLFFATRENRGRIGMRASWILLVMIGLAVAYAVPLTWVVAALAATPLVLALSYAATADSKLGPAQIRDKPGRVEVTSMAALLALTPLYFFLCQPWMAPEAVSVGGKPAFTPMSWVNGLEKLPS